MTAKFKIDLRAGTKLSEHFSNRRDCYKVVEVDNVLGYVVSSGGRESCEGDPLPQTRSEVR